MEKPDQNKATAEQCQHILQTLYDIYIEENHLDITVKVTVTEKG